MPSWHSWPRQNCGLPTCNKGTHSFKCSVLALSRTSFVVQSSQFEQLNWYLPGQDTQHPATVASPPEIWKARCTWVDAKKNTLSVSFKTTCWTAGPLVISDPISIIIYSRLVILQLFSEYRFITIDLYQHCHHYKRYETIINPPLPPLPSLPKHTWTRIGQKNVPATMAAHHRAVGFPWVDITSKTKRRIEAQAEGRTREHLINHHCCNI